MKKIHFLAVSLILMVSMAGCEEVEKPEVLEKKTALVENIDLSAISAPEEVSVYSAMGWECDPEEAVGIFLESDFREGEADAVGRRFTADSGTKNEKIVIVEDGGMACFGEGGHGSEHGIIFAGRSDYSDICEDSAYSEGIQDEYSCTGKLDDRGLDEKEDTFLAAKETISGCLERLGMKGYVLDAAAPLATGKKKKKAYWMCWKQMVDGIPLSDTLLENIGNKSAYNYRHSISSLDLQAYDSSLTVLFMGEELVRWVNCNVIQTDKMLGKYPVVSVSEAYQKVQERYPQEAGSIKPVLERAELQYELVKRDKKYYLYPVWVFGIRNEGGEYEWDYHLMDAVTGDYFKDIPAELIS